MEFLFPKIFVEIKIELGAVNLCYWLLFKYSIPLQIVKTRGLYRVLAGIMAILILFSSLGIAMDMHFCQDHLKSISLIGEASSCHEKVQKTCHADQKACKHHQDSKEEKDCCHNEQVSMDPIHIDAPAPVDQNWPEAELVVVTPLHIDLDSDFLVPEEIVTFRYKPPKPPPDLQLLFQVFLIWSLYNSNCAISMYNGCGFCHFE